MDSRKGKTRRERGGNPIKTTSTGKRRDPAALLLELGRRRQVVAERAPFDVVGAYPSLKQAPASSV